MATKEDILEQITEEYLLHRGYFVRHNIKYLPDRAHPEFISSQDSNHSDIDVIGFNPRLDGHDQTLVVNCKSWQSGFEIQKLIKLIESGGKNSGRPAWKAFRELTRPKWSDAFLRTIKEATGSERFTYVIAVAHIVGEREKWQNHRPFIDALGGNPIRLICFEEMISEIGEKLTKTVASTEVGRMLQMFKAAGLSLKPQ